MNRSFSSDTKDELTRLMPEDRCCQAAELSAILRLNGGMELAGKDEMALFATTESAALARKIFKIFKGLFSMPVTVVMEGRRRFHSSKHYLVRAHLKREHLEALRELGMIDEKNNLVYGVSPPMVKKECCKRSYLRGAFLARGSVNRPEGSYHLEIIFPTPAAALGVQKLAAAQGVEFKSTERKNTMVLYLKEAEAIADFLLLTGAGYALLEFENVRIYKSMKNQVNRVVNCETANLEKTLEASLRQAEMIRELVERHSIQGLPPDLRELALLRLEFPDSTLKELGQMLSPPLSKSGVAYRLKKLENLYAEQVKDNQFNV